ncbi:MAG: flavodoxin family protein [Firmicutes bacterium]|nr:flavodoxin family protein [Bacillota bacterium]
MKVLLFNGSPRKGNTKAALEALKKGLAQQIPEAEVEEILCEGKSIIPCRACDACGSMSRCIFADDSPQINAAVEAADAIVFATPVYWWGMSAQMKLIIDKFYARDRKFHGLKKKIGSIVIGEADQEDPEYGIIAKQFRCIADYLGWETVFQKSYTANKPSDLAADEAALAEIEGLAKLLK